ncbi:MAG TPA: hypothetical protein VF719_12300 [Abditibacteriaceae bacterium]|jgi:hypothetical protein
MANTYNLKSADAAIRAISRVRKHIPDREAPFSFDDDEIADFLEENNDVPKLAAADALESKATDEAFVQKVQTTLGEQTDGAKTADVVLKRAAMLRKQVADATTAAASEVAKAEIVPAGYFSIAPNS